MGILGIEPASWEEQPVFCIAEPSSHAVMALDLWCPYNMYYVKLYETTEWTVVWING